MLKMDKMKWRGPCGDIIWSGFHGFMTTILLFVLRSKSQSADSISYAYSIMTGENLFHPHHLGFQPSARLFLLASQKLGSPVSVIDTAQIHNALWMGAFVVFSLLTLRKLGFSRPIASAGGLFVLFSWGPWVYSTQVEVYVPAAACLMGIVWLSTQVSIWEGPPKYGILLALSLLWGLSILYHQSNVLFAFPIFFLLGGRVQKTTMVNFSFVCLFTGTVVFLLYVLAWRASGGLEFPADFITYTLLYANHPNPTWGNTEHFGLMGIYNLFHSQASAIIPIKNFPHWLRLTSVAALSLWIFLMWTSAIIRKGQPVVELQLSRAFAAWLVIYYLFFLWWLPTQVEFFIVTLIPFAFLTLGLLRWMLIQVGDIFDVQALKPSVVVFLIIAIIGCVNLFSTVLPNHKTPHVDDLWAALLTESLDETYLIGETFSVIERLKFFHGREDVFELPKILLSFYEGKVSESDRIIISGRALAVRAEFVTPAYELSGCSGIKNPAGWSSFVNWLFEVRQQHGGKVVARKSHRVKVGSRDVLLISKDDQVYDSLQKFQETL